VREPVESSHVYDPVVGKIGILCDENIKLINRMADIFFT
jgi:hypothetical protein